MSLQQLGDQTNQKTHVNSTRPLVKLIKIHSQNKMRYNLITWKSMDYCSTCVHCDLALFFRKLHLSLRSGKCNTFIFLRTKIFKNSEQNNQYDQIFANYNLAWQWDYNLFLGGKVITTPQYSGLQMNISPFWVQSC
jgi:hypothetical protein